MKVPKPRNTNSGWTHHRSARIVWPNDFLGSVASALVMDENSFASRGLNSDGLFCFQENPQPGRYRSLDEDAFVGVGGAREATSFSKRGLSKGGQLLEREISRVK